MRLEEDLFRYKKFPAFPGFTYSQPSMSDISDFEYNPEVGTLNVPKEYDKDRKKLY